MTAGLANTHASTDRSGFWRATPAGHQKLQDIKRRVEDSTMEMNGGTNEDDQKHDGRRNSTRDTEDKMRNAPRRRSYVAKCSSSSEESTM